MQKWDFFFVFAEYKRQRDPEGDPAAQALAAKLAGQVLNENKQIVYGCYVTGAYWYFMLLEGKKYYISRGFSASGNELFDIIRFLKALKKTIVKFTKN